MSAKLIRKWIRYCIVISTALLFVGSTLAMESNENTVKNAVPKKLSLGTYTFNPTDDTRIDEHNGGTGGSSIKIYTRNHQGISSHDWEIDSLIRFDISSIPTGIQVESASLFLFYVDYWDYDPSGRTITLRRITSDWDEETAEWSNQPTYNPTPLANAQIPDTIGNWMQFDVTSSVQDFIDGTMTNYGWRLSDDSDWGTFNIPCAHYSSKENGLNIPYLEVTVNDPPEVPQITGATNGNNGQSYDYTFITSDPNSDQIYYTIEWGDGQTNTWIGPYNSGQIVTIPHTWSEKGTYIIKAKAKDTKDLESDWGTLTVTMPCSVNIPFIHFWERLFEQYPNAFPILRQLLGY